MSAATDAVAAALDLSAWGMVLALAASDWRERRLPIALNRALLGTGLALALLRAGLSGLVWASAAALFAALPLLALRYVLPPAPAWRLGGGDTRLAAGIGAWLGLQAAWTVLALAFALTAAWAPLVGREARNSMPYGTFCAAAAVLNRLLFTP